LFNTTRFTDLVAWTGGQLRPGARADFLVRSLSSDTRSLQNGEVFVALRGDQFDGHRFIDEAIKRGAAGVIAETLPEGSPDVPFLIVEDALQAWINIAVKIRERFQGPVVAITGSAGKSSTKEMVAKLLGPDTVASPASFNNLLGVSKTLCLVGDATRNLVLEMGMNAPGEIREMCDRFRPEFGLISNIGDAHIGRLGGQEGIFRAKKELFDFLAAQPTKTQGIALNAEDPLVVRAAAEAFAMPVRTLRYSADPKTPADVWVKEKSLDPNRGSLRLTIAVAGDAFDISLPIYGMHHAQNVAGSIALATLMGVSLSEIRQRLSLIQAAPHRGQIMELAEGRVLIDESYNSNPTALISSLESLARLNPDKPRLLVLGEMREMGEYSRSLHQKVGRAVVELFTKLPITVVGVGKEMEAMAQEVRQGLPQVSVQVIETAEAAIDVVRQRFAPDSLCLVKGSRGVKLDIVVEALRRQL
jgi:UDP-N-acetylmuramoyl-tripeptide--D-alanyl-D-alanine ligase